MKAPFSWPKISLSISVSGMAAQLTATKGRDLARAQIVQRARHQFLAGSAFAGDQHGDIGGRDLLDQPENLPHRSGTAHQRAQHAGLAQPAPRHFQLDLRFALPGGVDQDGAQPRGVHRLLQKVVSAQLHGIDGQLDGAHGGEHHDGHVGVERRSLFGELGQQADAVQPRHLQVGDHNGRVPGQRLLPAFDAVARGLGAVSPAGDQLGQPHQRVGLVFDNQHLYRALHLPANPVSLVSITRADL